MHCPLLFNVTKPGFRTVQNDLTPISYKWRELGLQLDLDDGDLENITGEGNRCYRCLSSTLQHWVKNDRDATKAKLVETLKSSAIGERRLAGKVEQSGKHGKLYSGGHHHS